MAAPNKSVDKGGYFERSSCKNLLWPPPGEPGKSAMMNHMQSRHMAVLFPLEETKCQTFKSWPMLSYICTWRQRKMCRASRQTWRRSTTRQGKGYAESQGSLNSQPGNQRRLRRKMRQFNNYRLTVPTVLAAARVESKIGPTHIAHPGGEQGLYKDCGNSSGNKIYVRETAWESKSHLK